MKLRLAFILISLLLCATDANARARVVLTGEISKLHLISGFDLRFAILSPEGWVRFTLSESPSYTPGVPSENNFISRGTEHARPLVLFRGVVRRRYARMDQRYSDGVAASLINQRLKISFYGPRSGRLYEASFGISGSHTSLGKLKHLPRLLPVACAMEVSSGLERSSVGAMGVPTQTTGLRLLQLGVDADYEYVLAAGGSEAAATELSEVINIVNGLYSRQLGIEIALGAQNLSTLIDQPYTSRYVEDLLDSFSAYRTMSPFDAPVDAAHLFTGKNLTSYLAGSGVIGYSYLTHPASNPDFGVICRYDGRYSYSLGERVSPNTTFLAVLTAHEIGHNLSMLHTRSGVMTRAPSAETNRFMRQSLNAANLYVAEHGDCLPAVGPNISITQPSLRAGLFSIRAEGENFDGESCRFRLYGSKVRAALLTATNRKRSALLLASTRMRRDRRFRLSATLGGASPSRTTIKYYFLAELDCGGKFAATSALRTLRSTQRLLLERVRNRL